MIWIDLLVAYCTKSIPARWYECHPPNVVLRVVFISGCMGKKRICFGGPLVFISFDRLVVQRRRSTPRFPTRGLDSNNQEHCGCSSVFFRVLVSNLKDLECGRGNKKRADMHQPARYLPSEWAPLDLPDCIVLRGILARLHLILRG
jgi:hypothetical protein